MPRLSRPRRRRLEQENIPGNRGGYGATFHTRVETASLSRPKQSRRFFKPRWRCRNFPDRYEYGATKKVSLRPRWIGRDFSDQSGDCPHQGRYGANFQNRAERARHRKKIFETALDTARLSIPGWRRHHFRDRGGDGAIFHTRVQTASFSRPRRRRRDQESFSLRPQWIRRDASDQSGYGPQQGGCGATFQTKTESAHFFKPRWRCRNFPDRYEYGATKKVPLRPRWIGRDFSDQSGDCPHQGGYGANFQNRAKRTRHRKNSSRPRWIRRDFPYQGGYGITFETEAETARFSLPGCRRHHFPDRGGDGATKKVFLCDRGGYGAALAISVDMAHTKVDTAQLSRPRRRRRNQESISRDQGGDAASFQTKSEMARLLRTGRRGRYFPDQAKTAQSRILATKVETPRLSRLSRKWREGWRGLLSRPTRRQRDQEKFPRNRCGYGATFHTRVETASLSRPRRRRRDQENIPCDRGGYGAMAHTKVDTARISRPSRRRRNEESNSRDQGGDAASFQTKAEMARLSQNRAERALLSRPTRRRRDQEKFPRNRCGYGATFHTRVETASLSRPRRRRRDQENIPCDRGGYGATKIWPTTRWMRRNFPAKTESAHFFKPRWRCRDFQSEIATTLRWIRRDFSDQSGDCPHQGGYGANFQNRAERTRHRKNSSRPRWIRRDFPYQGADGIIFQTEAETVRPRKFFFATAVDTARL